MGLGQFSELRRGLAKEWGGVFEGGVDNPMHTMFLNSALSILPASQILRH